MDHSDNATSSRGRKATRSTNFTTLEDEAICRAWIYINEDAIVGVGQRVAHFWERIFENFKQRVSDDNKRTKDSIQSRFVMIQRACNRWKGIISSLERNARSGTTIQDRIVDAKTTFHLTYKAQFQFEHCWVILKDSPKWNSDLESRSAATKKRVISIDDVDDEDMQFTPTSSPTLNDPFLSQVGDESGGEVRSKSGSGSGSANKKTKRPPGTKAQKERLKKGGESNMMMEMLKEQMTRAAIERSRTNDQMTLYLKMKQDKEDDKLLLMDLSTVDPETAEYFQLKKQEIIQRKRAESMFGTLTGLGGGSGGEGASNN